MYVYLYDNRAPQSTDIECILEPDGLSRLRWHDPAVREAIRKVFKIGKNKRLCHRFQMWRPSTASWIPAPNSSDVLLLHPGEGLIFRHATVTKLEGFPFYEWLALPSDKRSHEPPIEEDRDASPERDVTPPPRALHPARPRRVTLRSELDTATFRSLPEREPPVTLAATRVAVSFP